MDLANIAVVARPGGRLAVEERPVPRPAADQALVRIGYGGICGSDLHYWLHGAAGESILAAPMVLGHEVVGTVVRPAADGGGPPEGATVAVHPATPAPDGARYPADRPNLSPGCTYLGSAARSPHTDGAFARYAALPARMLRALPSGLSLRDAAVAEPAAVAWHAVGRAGDIAGKRVLVVGAGPIGALTVAALRRGGAGEIVVSDVHERPRAAALALGASAALDAADAGSLDAVDADVVIESSGSHHGLAAALRGATRGGRVVMLGLLPPGPQPVPVSLAIARELELVGSFRFNAELDDVLTALGDGSLDAAGVVTHEFPAEDAPEAFEVARDSSASGKVLLRF